MSNLANHRKEFDKFKEEQWNKILSVQHKNYSDDYMFTKSHFVEEILECFNIRDTNEGQIIKDILMRREIDNRELIDVANMSFAMKLFRYKS